MIQIKMKTQTPNQPTPNSSEISTPPLTPTSIPPTTPTQNPPAQKSPKTRTAHPTPTPTPFPCLPNKPLNLNPKLPRSLLSPPPKFINPSQMPNPSP